MGEPPAPLSPVLGGEGSGVRGTASHASTRLFRVTTSPPHPDPLPRVQGRGGIQIGKLLFTAFLVPEGRDEACDHAFCGTQLGRRTSCPRAPGRGAGRVFAGDGTGLVSGVRLVSEPL